MISTVLSRLRAATPQWPSHGPSHRSLSGRAVRRAVYVLQDSETFSLSEKVENVRHNGMVFVPKGTVKAVRMDSENMAVLDLHTPMGPSS